MRKLFLFIVFFPILVSFKKVNSNFFKTYVECESKQDTLVSKVKYINSINSYVRHINISLKDCDSLSAEEINSIKARRNFSKNVTQKNVIYKNDKIVKVKYKDFLENNFVKVKSFYYDNNNLVCVNIIELLPTEESYAKIYERRFYYFNNSLMLDTKEDDKYQIENLLSFGVKKLKEEYQLKNQ